MGIFELILLAVGLSMDAFAAAVCKGLSLSRVTKKEICVVGLWFGGFQALMPLLGFFLGTTFEKYITSVDHWIAFALLSVIGGNMIREAFSGEEEKADDSIAVGKMAVLAVATSIDALAVGITFAFLIKETAYLILAVLLIGVITFALSCLGVKAGSVFGAKYKKTAELAGGIILILLGIKILLEHLGYISF